MEHITSPAKRSVIFRIYMAEVILTNLTLFTKNHPSIPSPFYADTPAISSRYLQNSLHFALFITFATKQPNFCQ